MRRQPGFVVIATVLVLASCGDDDDGSDTTAGASPSATVQQTTSPPTTPVDSAATTAPPPSTGAPGTTATTTPPTSAATTQPPTTPPQTAGGAERVLGDPNVTFTHIGEPRPGLVEVTAAPVGGLYQVFQDGVIRLTTADGADTAVALDITELSQSGGEQGLLGLAVHPSDPLAYVNYTNNDGNTVVVEYQLAGDGTFVADSARPLLEIPDPYANHNGGNMVFGPDGFLYIATGDGGSAGDPERRALNLGELLGKLLRIDPAPSGNQPYTVPADNPFVDEASARPEVWSYGLRNPWRFAFDQTTGDLWIADVGQGAIEEIDVARAENGQGAGRGLSFGWSAFEGTHRYNDDQPAEGHIPPVYEYDHSDGRCSVSGAAPYTSDHIPELAGGFVFGDYCTGEVWAMPMFGDTQIVDLGSVPSLSAVRIIGDELYALSLTDGLYRVDPA
jgi:glucose/arabinose dehydrogenase